MQQLRHQRVTIRPRDLVGFTGACGFSKVNDGLRGAATLSDLPRHASRGGPVHGPMS